MLRKQIKVLVILGVMLIIVTGCATNRGGTVKQQQVNEPQVNEQVRTQKQVISKDYVQIAAMASENVARLNGVRHVNVLVTDKNAYVAVVLNPKQSLSRNFENRIAQSVRSTDPTLQHVYISVNPDFVSRVQTYVNDVRQGKPVTGFYNEFVKMVKRVFPTAK
jgi:YhcN/YlaJ family sporulation lipoprotein